jgi:MoxR-like ATPases
VSLLKEEIQALHNEFKEHFIERDEEILGAILAILANENVLYLGPPGTAKTYLAQNICKSIEGAQFFYYLLTRFTTPEEIFGPLSIQSLEKDVFKRKIDGCLPSAHIALLDEIFKANSSILNSLLTLLNERRFHNGTEVIDTPLLTVFGASNELPEEDENLEALYDRFLFRYDVRYIQNEDNVKSLLFINNAEFSPKVKLNIDSIKKIRVQAQSIEVSDEVQDILLSLKKHLERKDSEDTESIQISDRRWKKIVGVLKVAAAANGKKKVDRTMLLLLQHMLWDLPDQKEALRTLIIELMVTGGIDTEKLDLEITNLQKIVDDAKEILNDEKLPVSIHVRKNWDDTEISTYKELVEAYQNGNNPQLLFEDEMNYSRYNFDTVLKKLKENYNFTPKMDLAAEKKIIYEKEYKNIEKQYKTHYKNVRTLFDEMKKDLESNIWLTSHDVDEVSLIQQNKLNNVHMLEEKLGAIKTAFQS